MQELDWFGCYSDSFRGIIIEQAFAHPAKMAWGLTMRIFQHLFEEEWLKEGDLVADPFGGIGTTGLAASALGCFSILVELEPKFVELAKQNFALHEDEWDKMGKPHPMILQGDSRQFSQLVGEAIDLVLTSPPYAKAHSAVSSPGGILDTNRQDLRKWVWTRGTQGQSPGQLGAMKEGDWEEVVSSIITSPPYGDTFSEREGGAVNPDWASVQDEATIFQLGKTRGQLGSMPEGSHKATVDGIVTSPPYERAQNGGGIARALTGDSDYPVSKQVGRIQGYQAKHQGDTLGQIGQEEGETYWSSIAQVYRECFKVLRLGGIMAVVVKSFVRNKQIVDLPSQTLELLTAIGFVPLERIKAWLVAPAVQRSMMPETVPHYRKERKSFFRRLAESKGSPRIDFEEVLIVQKSRY